MAFSTNPAHAEHPDDGEQGLGLQPQLRTKEMREFKRGRRESLKR